MGYIGVNSKQIDSIAVVFDLSGFTRFCSRADAHLRMPVFLKEFLKWLFEKIRSSIVMQIFEEGIRPYTHLPYFAKFMGDGVLFLWNTEDMDNDSICNAVIQMDNISCEYEDFFMKRMRKSIANIPERLRCAVARGQVCSVGNGQDYVGQCINLASRLQKDSGLRFCCWNEGIYIKEGMLKSSRELYTRKIMGIRGIGREEIVIIRHEDFEELSDEEKESFREP